MSSTSGSGHVDFYWRPGCPFCMTLERSLGKQGVPLTKHNIWDDPAAAAHVRSVANGNETVPTVTIGGTSLVNPSAKEVVAVATRELPGFSPEPPAPRGLRAVLRRD
ncbi:MAG: glutaredoxin domain-containing protein [Acidimicrobiales bacterium]